MWTTSEHASIGCLRTLCFCHTSATYKHSAQVFMHLVMAKGSEHICIFVNWYADGHITDIYTMCHICTEGSQPAIYCGSDPSSKTTQFRYACSRLPRPPSQAHQLLTMIYLFLPSETKLIWACLFINFRVVFEAHVIRINRNHQDYSQSLVDK